MRSGLFLVSSCCMLSQSLMQANLIFNDNSLKALSKMKPSAVLVNTSRGPVVDLEALYEALKAKRIFAAGLDVTDPEPLPADHPLLTLDNIVIVPHIASATKTARDKMAWLAAENLIAGLKGDHLPNCVNPHVYK